MSIMRCSELRITLILMRVIILVVICFLFVGNDYAQKGALFETPETVVLEGEIIAEDNFSQSIYIETSPPLRLFLMRIDHLKSGFEQEEFALISHRPSKKGLFIRSTSDGKVRLKMTVKRARNCDSEVDEIWRIFAERPPAKDYPPLRWYRTDLKVPRGTVFPCYLLSDTDIRSLD